MQNSSPAVARAAAQCRQAGTAPASIGLYHVAFKIGNELQQLRTCRDHLDQHGIPILGASDHTVSQSLYIQDPDGIEIELYVDADPSVWRNDPAVIATIKPLKL